MRPNIAMRHWGVMALVALTMMLTTVSTAWAQKKKPSTLVAEEMLKTPARPARPELPASELPLKFIANERIALIGNSTAERMNLFGHFETRLQLRFHELKLVVRNFARPADEVSLRQRSNDYTKLDDPLKAFGADTYFCFFGFNESFDGAAGVEKYKRDYVNFLREFAQSYPRDDAGNQPRFVLIAPISCEDMAGMGVGAERRAELERYAQATAEVAQQQKLAFVDAFAATNAQLSPQPGPRWTHNGVHLSEAGDGMLAEALDKALFGSALDVSQRTAQYEPLRAAINEKSWLHLQDYRMLNGWYIYGGRRTWDTETFPREYVKLRNMVAERDEQVWSLASGKGDTPAPDDSDTGELIVPTTRFGEPRQAYSENAEGGPVILPPAEQIRRCEVPPGFEMKLFADESRFPEIAKPVQLSFDNKGRLWVATMPSYPQWKPGDPKPSDKLVILEDQDGDGVADKSTVFYDKLHCPTGFEFFDGGVLVVDQPRLIWLKDTNGDDQADSVVHLQDGWATEDTHHTVGAFESSHGGRLHMLEGVAMSTTVETPWGPFRNFGSSGCYVLDPRTHKISHYVTPGYGNPWCYVFDEWGQGFCGDGTGANQHWDTPLSGYQYRGRKGMNAVFNTEGMRPVIGSEFLLSRHFPDDVQGQFVYACVINMNGLPRWTWNDDGAGYKGVRVRHNPNDPNTPYDLLKSNDKHFRPVDPQIGPDGALWFGDWANPLIGHMQYSQRDPNRDHTHGRIYRLVYRDKPLLQPVTQFGKTEAELLEQLRAYEWRTRTRARHELQARPQQQVLAAANAWLKSIPAADPARDRLRSEVMWLQQSFHAVDASLLQDLLACATPQARAAAVRVMSDERDYLPNVDTWLAKHTSDVHPRVSTEAIRGLSYYPTLDAARSVLTALSKHSEDSYVRYTADAALGAHVNVWRSAYLKGDFAKGDAVSRPMLDSVIATDKKAAELIPHLQLLLGKDAFSEEQRNKALQSLSDAEGGNAENGRQVFRRSCLACHRAMNEGANFGPDMAKVGTRLTPYKIVESIIDPNAEVDKKYLSTAVVTHSGKVITGLLVSDQDGVVIIFDGKTQVSIPVAEIEERNVLKQSSMPEGLAATLSPVEFLDVIAFLKGMK